MSAEEVGPVDVHKERSTAPSIDVATALVIANPRAGGGSVARRWDRILRSVRGALGEIAIERTAGPGDATRIARAAIARGVTTLLSLGGDGTHHEIVRGVHEASALDGSITLGVLPAGTGGDFKRMLLGDGTLAGHARRLAAARATAIDVGLARFVDERGDRVERPFLNLASAGMSALVCARVNRSKKALGGRLTFFLATLAVLSRFRGARVRIAVDGRDLGERLVNTIAIANGQFAGGGMRFAPNARLDDGALDVTVIGESGLLGALALSPAMYGGRILESRGVEGDRGARITITSDDERPVHLELDGEPVGVAPIEIEVVPRALRLLALR